MNGNFFGVLFKRKERRIRHDVFPTARCSIVFQRNGKEVAAFP